MSVLAGSEDYYTTYSTIMEHLEKVGNNPDMSEEYLVGTINDILQEMSPQIKAMCILGIGNRPTGRGVNLKMGSGLIQFIGLYIQTIGQMSVKLL